MPKGFFYQDFCWGALCAPSWGMIRQKYSRAHRVKFTVVEGELKKSTMPQICYSFSSEGNIFIHFYLHPFFNNSLFYY